MPRFKACLFILLYCVVLLLAFDLIYSKFFAEAEDGASARIGDARYHHGLAANFHGYDRWGYLHYPFYTNSLGLKDAAVRNIPLKSDTHRILLIGDSFTEALGMSFEESFAGLLHKAGQQRTGKIEFLNAGVSGYSPVIYLQRIKTILDGGLEFHQAVVFLDISDIAEEATAYFCIDDAPKYRRYCDPQETSEISTAAAELKRALKRNFVVLDRTRFMIKNGIRGQRTDRSVVERVLAIDSAVNSESSWTFSGARIDLPPLGLDGGIARALKNMAALAELLSERRIPLIIAVYPWPVQLAHNDRDSRHIAIWREFCLKNCKDFIDLFPAFFAEKETHEDWYDRLYIRGDIHFSARGHALMFRELSKHLF